MRVLEGPHSLWQTPDTGTSVTVGVFDGVHLGHQQILDRLKALSAGRPVVAVTFEPHPVAVLAPGRAPKVLSTPDQRVRQLERVGVDLVGVLDFNDELRLMPAGRFVQEILLDTLRAEVIVVGNNFRFGHRGEGDTELLEQLSTRHGFVFEAVGLIGDERPISSTRVREALADGDLVEAERLIGRPYTLSGVVVIGEGRGKTIGIPTANLGLRSNQFVPGHGVYAVMVDVAGRTVRGVCNVGVRPTFEEINEVAEVHLFEFDEDLYGEVLEVEFRHRIRGERAFDGIDELVAQIRRDIETATALLSAGASET